MEVKLRFHCLGKVEIPFLSEVNLKFSYSDDPNCSIVIEDQKVSDLIKKFEEGNVYHFWMAKQGDNSVFDIYIYSESYERFVSMLQSLNELGTLID